MAKLPNINDKFLTLEALEEAAQAAAKAQGFAFSRRNSNLERNKGRLPYVVLQCTRSENWCNNWDITRKSCKKESKTNRICCPIFIRATITKKQLSVVWVITKAEYIHNHSLLQPDEIVSLSQHRNLSVDQKKLFGIVMPKDVINKHAQIRYALNEDPNADSAQKLLCKHEYAKCPEVLIVDSTYKTNIYKFLLVNVVGISNITNNRGLLKTFQIAMA
ncbi:14344_t:CDS:2 [Cetraspora pellucida]|uniref:14344_t:CDS:1 n=1 Tax=Cetraspora pellucida TaxID=1433469 RepID=A0A9N9NW06_9GLOM|nr:14344_t:CDS:2 [Cetraspora pellucida]